MRIARNNWEKFIGWFFVFNFIVICSLSSKTLMAHGISYFIKHLIGYYVSAFIFGIPFGSITYGIWYILIERKRKVAQESLKSKWNGVKNELKIIGFSIIGYIICFVLYGFIKKMIYLIFVYRFPK